MNVYFPATLPFSHGQSGGVVVAAKYEGATKQITTTPVAAYSGWWSHKQAMIKTANKAEAMAFYDAATSGNRVRKTELPENARAAAVAAGLDLKTLSSAWLVG